ncbi:hypothetical protein AB0M43_00850 [Longispora sp. NPDC051575]|uniref:hypothetical protein n=1 Tax=Longispora sp. NPDC051575 TaxID=3154943 RepID=UPI00342CD192
MLDALESSRRRQRAVWWAVCAAVVAVVAGLALWPTARNAWPAEGECVELESGAKMCAPGPLGGRDGRMPTRAEFEASDRLLALEFAGSWEMGAPPLELPGGSYRLWAACEGGGTVRVEVVGGTRKLGSMTVGCDGRMGMAMGFTSPTRLDENGVTLHPEPTTFTATAFSGRVTNAEFFVGRSR